MIDLATLASCAELTAEHAKQAAGSSSEIRKLLKRVVEIAAPEEGCPKILMAVARLVGQDWVEGDLRVELSGDESTTTLDIMCDHGSGIRERLLPIARFKVPMDEFERALELAPKLVLPLRISEEDGKLVLTPLATPERKMSSPQNIAIDDASLGEADRKTAPPPPDELQVVDEANPEEVLPAQMKSGPVPTAKNASGPAPSRPSNVHTRPTVRRLVAVDAAAIAAVKRRDPRRDDD